MSETPLPGLEALLDYLRSTHAFDFSGYKRASLQRRILKRMGMAGVASADDYMRVLAERKDEIGHLIDTILINVTGFFRDDATWELVRGTIVPRILESNGPGAQIRIWSAGCASGEEAYSIAMAFAEELGTDAFAQRVKIYATDLDDNALTAARLGTYSEKAVGAVPPELRQKYFDQTPGGFSFRRDLRRSVVFGRNDLTRDVPISRLDLLMCRNTLMYFDMEMQRQIATRFEFALNPGGYLVLGRAETLLTHGTFVPVDLKRRVFVRLRSQRNMVPFAPARRSTAEERSLADSARVRHLAADTLDVAQMVVDRSGTLLAASERARAMFRLAPGAIHRPLHELEVSYRPADLRSALDRAYAEHRTVLARAIEWRDAAGGVHWLDLAVTPLVAAGVPLGASIVFTDVTSERALRTELERAQEELMSAYEELQSTNEELETTNEELQSTVAELETTNEELQSANEEMETMNAELLATNDELRTLNDQSVHSSDMPAELNAYADSVFGSLHIGVAVLDRDLTVRLWNNSAEELWGVRSEEVVHTPFLELDIGLPVDRLSTEISAALSGEPRHRPIVLRSINRRGRAIECSVTIAPVTSSDSTYGAEHGGVVVLMEEVRPDP